MELKQLFKIFLRWWWLLVIPPVVVGGYVLATYQAPSGGYTLSLRYTAGQPAAGETTGYDPNYYRWLTSEYIVTALKDWVQTGQFAATVQATLVANGHANVPVSIAAADNARSILVVYLAGNSPDDLVALANAVTEVLQNGNAAVFPQLGGQAAQVTLLDTPAPAPVSPGLRAQLDAPLKVGLALLVGVALVFIAHYFDPFARDKEELERMGLRVLGEVPRQR